VPFLAENQRRADCKREEVKGRRKKNSKINLRVRGNRRKPRERAKTDRGGVCKGSNKKEKQGEKEGSNLGVCTKKLRTRVRQKVLCSEGTLGKGWSA